MIITKDVEVSWNPKTKSHYEKYGHRFTKLNEKFVVPIQHLMISSNIKIVIKFDCCGEPITRRFSTHMEIKNNILDDLDICTNCKNKNKKEIKQSIKQSKVITENDKGFWTYKKNRMDALHQFIKQHGTLQGMLDDKQGKRIYHNFNKHTHEISDAARELGYNIAQLGFTFKGLYNNFELIKEKIDLFIENNSRFPTLKEIVKTLKIDQRYIDKLGGIYELRRRMNYVDINDLIDDNGWKNNSVYEWTVAQFLIHNTEITYKREQNPFPKVEGYYRSDFTFFPEDKREIHIEIWGYDLKYKSKITIKYNENKQEKLRLYKKYNINIISINKEVFENRNISDITKDLYDIFSPIIDINFKTIEQSYLIHPFSMTDEEILDEIMNYSIDYDCLPTIKHLNSLGKTRIIAEIRRRYKYYHIFGEKFNKSVSKSFNYWNEELILKNLETFLREGNVINKESLNKFRNGFYDVIIKHFGSIIQCKLIIYNTFIDLIQPLEVVFLKNVLQNRGINIMNKVIPEQQELANNILERIHKSAS